MSGRWLGLGNGLGSASGCTLLAAQLTIGRFELLAQLQRSMPVFGIAHVCWRCVAVEDVVKIKYRNMPQSNPQ
jgi:hypothetical protein